MQYAKKLDGTYVYGDDVGGVEKLWELTYEKAKEEGKIKATKDLDVDALNYFKTLSPVIHTDVDLNSDVSEITDMVLRYAVSGMFGYPVDTSIPIAKFISGELLRKPGIYLELAPDVTVDPLYREKALAAAAHVITYMGELLGMRVTAEVDSELLATDFLGGERSVCDKVDLAVGFNAMLKEAEAQDEPDVDFDDSAPLKPTEEDALYLLR